MERVLQFSDTYSIGDALMAYYVRQGGRETLYNTQDAAYKAAQKLANATGQSVKVGITSITGDSARRGRAVPRKPSGKRAFKKNPSDHMLYGAQGLSGPMLPPISAQQIWRAVFGAKKKAEALIRKMTPTAQAKAESDGPYTVSWTDHRGRKSTDAATRKEAEAVAKALRAVRVKQVEIA